MSTHENIIKDIEILKVTLDLDFINNLSALVALVATVYLMFISWDVNNYLAFVISIISFIYIYCRYLGADFGNMHRLPLAEKALTRSYVQKHQALLANNFFKYLTSFPRVEQTLDSWELDKVESFKRTKRLDNATALIIYALYKEQLNKLNHAIPTCE